MTLEGKGFYIWKIKECEGGNIADIVAMVQDAKLKHLIIKIADGVYAYNIDIDGNDLVPPLIAALRAAIPGIQIWGWHYIYGNNPSGEAAIALARINDLDIDGYVINAEGHYKNKHSQAEQFMGNLRDDTNIPMALSSYRFPHYHPEFPWDEFLSGVQINMPQVYWKFAHNSAEQLVESIADFDILYDQLGYEVPIFPTGAAFGESGWAAEPEEVGSFLTQAKSLGLPGCTFWEYAEARHQHPELWEVIANFEWDDVPDLIPVPGPEPIEPVPDQPKEPLEIKPLKIVNITASALNIRDYPGALEDKDDIGTLLGGSEVPVVAEHGDWYEIRGYISKKYTTAA